MAKTDSNKKSITNNVNEYKTLTWAELRQYECNTLKQGEQRNVQKLKNAIVNRGFNFPLYVWAGRQYVIDGAGRVAALAELEREGWTIPELPIVEITAASLKEAKALVLQASSEHGKVTQESFAAFVEDLDIDSLMDEICFPDIDLGPDEIEVETKADKTPSVDFENKWEVVAECESEEEQEKAFNILEKAGFKCRILTL